MARARTSTGADRLLTMFIENVRRTRERGLSNIHIEDSELEPGRIGVRSRSVANFGDCSYLGLGKDARLIEAATRAIERYGTSYSSSIAYTALPHYEALRERIETMMGAHVVVAPTTTLAHASALPVIVRPGDSVLMDSAVHNSVQMASQLLVAAGIEVATIPHNDTVALEEAILAAEAADAPRIWYLADGVYSMSGATAPFAAIHGLLERHPTLWAYIDDAHGFGWHGQTGRGLAIDRIGWHDRLVIAVGLAKAFGTAGGIVASPDADLIELIRMCGPPLSFGGPIPPATLGASVASADIHLSEELLDLQAMLAERIITANRTAQDLGLPMVRVDHTPIFFVECGRMDAMLEIVDGMLDDGFYVNGAMWPIVPHRRAGIRFTVTNSHALPTVESMLERLTHHFGRVVGPERITIDLRSDDPVVEIGDQPG